MALTNRDGAVTGHGAGLVLFIVFTTTKCLMNSHRGDVSKLDVGRVAEIE